MKCPLDATDLQMTERQGIEIDYCPTCRGVWLDRGELDKLIERGSAQMPQQAPRMPEYPERAYRDDYRQGHGKHHRREGFLGDIFDF